jgi:glycosyltransferase involved in cell wall biosynthesis
VTLAPRVSFIIISRDEPFERLKRTVQGIRETVPGWREIVVVDDGSIYRVPDLGSEVQVYRNTKPRGTSASRRIGCQIASGDYYCNLDAHMLFRPGWLEEMLQVADEQNLVCSHYTGEEWKRGFTGANLGWTEQGFSFKLRNGRGQRFPTVPILVGACYLVKATLYQHLGGFSPCFWEWGLEEHDLSIRAWLAGYSVRCANRALVAHVKSKEIPPFPLKRESRRVNSQIILRTVFQQDTYELMAHYFPPLKGRSKEHWEKTDFDEWRQKIGRLRVLSDADFLQRFGALMPLRPKSNDSLALRPRTRAPGWAPREAARLGQSEAASKREHAKVDSALRISVLGRKFSLKGSLPPGILDELPTPHKLLKPKGRSEQLFEVQELSGLYRFDKETGRKPYYEHEDFLEILSTRIRQNAARNGSAHWAVPGAVLMLRGRLLVIVGEPSTGARNVGECLSRLGALWVSDCFWILDHDGRTRPYFHKAGSDRRHRGRTVKATPSLFLFPQIRPGARWRPRKLSCSKVITRLIGMTGKKSVGALIPHLAAFTMSSPAYRSSYDLAEDVARWIYRKVENWPC